MQRSRCGLRKERGEFSASVCRSGLRARALWRLGYEVFVWSTAVFRIYGL